MNPSTILFKSQKHEIVGLLNVPKQNKESLVILLHGLTNSMKDCPLINEVSEALWKRGFSTFRFDYYGSGLSDGEFIDKTFSVLVENTKDALDYATAQLGYKKVGIWGRSLGAIIGATISDNPKVGASVLISTTIHTKISFSSFFKDQNALSIPFKGTGVMKGKPVLRRKFYEETDWIDNLQKKHLSKAHRVLIIQGAEDKTVYDTAWAKEIYQLTQKPKKLVYIKGADHSYCGFEPRVIEEGVVWFTKHLT